MYIQILFSLFVLMIFYTLFTKKQNYKINPTQFWSWFIFWLLAIIIFWLPDTTSYFANILGIGRGVDLIVYIAIIVLFYLQFKTYLLIEKQNNDITKIVREISLNKVKKNDQK